MKAHFEENGFCRKCGMPREVRGIECCAECKRGNHTFGVAMEDIPKGEYGWVLVPGTSSTGFGGHYRITGDKVEVILDVKLNLN